jgi:hypothetical protein
MPKAKPACRPSPELMMSFPGQLTPAILKREDAMPTLIKIKK